MLASGIWPEALSDVPPVVFAEFMDQWGAYPVHDVELNGSTHPAVLCFVVVRVKRGTYRALLIARKADGDEVRPCLFGFESDRESVSRWLRTRGVPALRIGAEQ